ncbi:unnamed protein product [Caenorhabditis auriculariae]|uniref:Uncharacterized protein n=1 Tax=Caenorhabditis auriculariae TaxID=2777116 RepID=A0A8S1HD39_9PELO|nr:unnamed protein product [Caenorhabditis auriculariae]
MHRTKPSVRSNEEKPRRSKPSRDAYSTVGSTQPSLYASEQVVEAPPAAAAAHNSTPLSKRSVFQNLSKRMSVLKVTTKKATKRSLKDHLPNGGQKMTSNKKSIKLKQKQSFTKSPLKVAGSMSEKKHMRRPLSKGPIIATPPKTKNGSGSVSSKDANRDEIMKKKAEPVEPVVLKKPKSNRDRDANKTDNSFRKKKSGGQPKRKDSREQENKDKENSGQKGKNDKYKEIWNQPMAVVSCENAVKEHFSRRRAKRAKEAQDKAKNVNLDVIPAREPVLRGRTRLPISEICVEEATYDENLRKKVEKSKEVIDENGTPFWCKSSGDIESESELVAEGAELEGRLTSDHVIQACEGIITLSPPVPLPTFDVYADLVELSGQDDVHFSIDMVVSNTIRSMTNDVMKGPKEEKTLHHNSIMAPAPGNVPKPNDLVNLPTFPVVHYSYDRKHPIETAAKAVKKQKDSQKPS